jgi:hypothetical protein
MPGDTMSVAARFGALIAREALIDLGTETYTVGSVDWENGALQYDQNFQPRIEGLDFNHMDLTDINIGIDSISVEAQVFRKEIMVYPFLLNLHNYQLCIAGQHNLAKNCTYHLELLKSPLPLRLAIDVKGNLSKPKIELGDIRYGEMYIPDKSDAFQQRTLELKGLVRKALEANVR